MTNKDIETLYKGINSLRQRTDLRLPARASFTLIRGARALLPLVEDCENARLAVLQHYGTPTEDGQFKVPAEDLDKVLSEIEDLENIEVNVDLPRIKLKDVENLDLSIQEAEALDLIIEEES